MNKAINVLFDGPPEHTSGRFIEVEDDQGHSISVGQWEERANGYWALRLEPAKILNTYHLTYIETGYEKTPFDGLFRAESAIAAVAKLTPRQKMVSIKLVEAPGGRSGTPQRANTAAPERKPKATPTRDKEQETK